MTTCCELYIKVAFLAPVSTLFSCSNVHGTSFTSLRFVHHSLLLKCVSSHKSPKWPKMFSKPASPPGCPLQTAFTPPSPFPSTQASTASNMSSPSPFSPMAEAESRCVGPKATPKSNTSASVPGPGVTKPPSIGTPPNSPPSRKLGKSSGSLDSIGSTQRKPMATASLSDLRGPLLWPGPRRVCHSDEVVRRSQSNEYTLSQARPG